MEANVDGANTADDDEMVKDLQSLPHDLQCLILDALPTARNLAQAACCCSDWRSAVKGIACSRLNRLVALSQTECPRPLRALAAAEWLASAIGDNPIDRTWQNEWCRARLKQARHLAWARGRDRLFAYDQQVQALGQDAQNFFLPGGAGSIDAEVATSCRSSIAWKLRDRGGGWNDDSALEVSLLGSRCSSALSSALLQRERALAASCWTLCTHLWRRSWRIANERAVVAATESAPLHPPCYAHLDGEFGLATDDPTWEALRPVGLRGALAAEGLTFVTRGFPFAMAANGNSFPDGRGFRVPFTDKLGTVSYELANSDLVRFIAAPSDVSACRSLLPCDEDIFRLPPLATVTLLRILEAREWEAVEGTPVERRCYEVGVEF
jgi:hypothetical protein